jgi:hypothetical protein
MRLRSMSSEAKSESLQNTAIIENHTSPPINKTIVKLDAAKKWKLILKENDEVRKIMSTCLARKR